MKLLWTVLVKSLQCCVYFIFIVFAMVIPDAESPGPVKKRPRLSLKVQKNGESKGDIKPEKQETACGEEGEE